METLKGGKYIMITLVRTEDPQLKKAADILEFNGTVLLDDKYLSGATRCIVTVAHLNRGTEISECCVKNKSSLNTLKSVRIDERVHTNGSMTFSINPAFITALGNGRIPLNVTTGGETITVNVRHCVELSMEIKKKTLWIKFEEKN